jgi:hypothetical protein
MPGPFATTTETNVGPAAGQGPTAARRWRSRSTARRTWGRAASATR